MNMHIFYEYIWKSVYCSAYIGPCEGYAITVIHPHLRSDAYSAEQVLWNKQPNSGGRVAELVCTVTL